LIDIIAQHPSLMLCALFVLKTLKQPGSVDHTLQSQLILARKSWLVFNLAAISHAAY